MVPARNFGPRPAEALPDETWQNGKGGNGGSFCGRCLVVLVWLQSPCMYMALNLLCTSWACCKVPEQFVLAPAKSQNLTFGSF